MGTKVIMESTSKTSRHLRWENFQSRIDDGLPSLEPLEGSPLVTLFIEPGGRRIGIRFVATKVGDVSSPLAEIEIYKVRAGQHAALEISTGNRDLFRDFYTFCCTLADRVQIEREPIENAVRTTLSRWAALIRRKALLSENRQSGLFGELIFLRRIADGIGWARAAKCWQGPFSEEHDFTLPVTDVEVKTTRSEHRLHKISSITQLLPKLNRPLFLVSVQITPGLGKGSQSLAQLVSSVVSAAIQEAPQAVEVIRGRLQEQGWFDDDAPQYNTRYHLRAPLAAIPVDRSCPAVVPATLASLGVERLARLESLSYSVNLDGLGVHDGTKQFSRLLFPKE